LQKIPETGLQLRERGVREVCDEFEKLRHLEKQLQEKNKEQQVEIQRLKQLVAEIQFNDHNAKSDNKSGKSLTCPAQVRLDSSLTASV